MKPTTVAAKLAWRFGALFLVGLLMVSAFAYFELILEPRLFPEEKEPTVEALAEIAAEATIPIALMSFAGWWLARRALRPAALMAQTADRIHEGNLNEKMVVPLGHTEFQRLADVFNAMTERLSGSFQRVRQFTLYASHELKTPLTVLHAEFERLLDDPTRSEADRATFIRQLDEIKRLSAIVDGLTFLTKADSHLVPLKIEPVSLPPLVRAAAEDTSVLGAEQNIAVNIDRCDEAVIPGDRHRLRQMLVILCDNAVKYNHPNGSVQLNLEKTGERVRLAISNTGPGIPAAEQGRVFERFYRGSNVLADRIDGVGLGLSVAQWIAGEHGGTLTFHSGADLTEFVFETSGAPSS